MTTSPNFLPVPEVKYTQKSPILGEFEVSVHGSLMNSKMQDAFTRLQKRVKMAGFREGKVPLDLVKRKFGDDVLSHIRDMSSVPLRRQLLETSAVPA